MKEWTLKFIQSCQFGFLVLLCFYRTHYHGLPYALLYMLQYFYGNFAPFLLVTIFSTLPEVLLNVVRYIFSKINA